MLRHDRSSILGRIGALGVAAVLLGTPAIGRAHFQPHYPDFNHGRDRDHHGRGDDDGHDCNGGKAECSRASQCDDKNPCTLDACNAGKCSHSPMAGCQVCQSDCDCAPANACSRGDCNHGVCRQLPVGDCHACTTDAGCDDGNPCTTDSCEAGVCTSKPIDGCVACRSCGECDDHNPCTNDQCGDDGVCHATPVAGCVACTTAADCDDQNPQTTDICTGGFCVHHPVEQPPVEICDDGIDNDGNGKADCADSACAAFAGCKPKEICGDCIDNDGDGLVDFEDPDCGCTQPMPLVLKKIIMRPGAKKNQDKLKIRSLYTRNMPLSFDPTKQDTTLQIRGSNGELFCTTIKSSHFMPRGQHSMAFWNGASFANGLTDGRFTIKHNKSVAFRTHGKTANITPATSGDDLLVTLRVGAHCSQASLKPRAKKAVLLFP